MKIVLDTNVLLVSLSPRSRLHWIFQALLNGRFDLCVTTDILAEYAEIIARHMGQTASENALGTLENLPNVERITSYYRFRLLRDEDDNKFVDCAIAANATAIVTHDTDFEGLKQVPFPVVRCIDTTMFGQMLQQSQV